MYTKKEVQKNAIVDAKNNIPSRDDPNFSQFEQECMAMANNEARQVMTKFEPQLEMLNGKHKPMLKEYQRISKDYDAHSKKIERSEPSVELTRGKYYILMFLFVLGEIPMNTIAFSVFRESQIFTWIMALGVAVAIPWIAHAVGILIKRGSVPWWKNGIGVATLLMLTVGGLAAIGYVRTEYLKDFSSTGETVASFAHSSFMGIAFVGLNLVILAAAILCSYFAHDKDPLLEHLHRKTNQINKAMRAIEAKHNKIVTEQDQKINRIHQQTQENIYYYRKINQRERPDHEKPKSFEKEHEVILDYEAKGRSGNVQKMLNATMQMQAPTAGQ
ncbi:hypothetical protein D1BOALGB6SA_3394 [Olavius sp. associated proteobacterium Delta 1]|nr:hypothetical protein D1BOALGB6SA_3394 [Olavius sp. associated proteobacterium Delta 1]